ncbi:MAG: acyltransferase family protein, partial [Prevotella sp.]|nr:acyltransferase family protein [Prevotella sp.]
MKGIGIIAVIIGHMGSVSIIPFHIFIFSFHMPLFFIIAGYFFKPNNNFINKFKRDFSRLVIPYLFTASILVVFNILQSFIGEEKKPDVITIGIISALFGSGAGHFSPIWGNLPAIGAIWFLLALFWCRVVYNYIACKT